VTPGPVDDPHRVLGIVSGADASAVRAAWRQAARRSHPDRGGDVAEFRRARLAVSLLRDAADRTGEARPTAVRHLRGSQLAMRWWRRRRDRVQRPRVI
jgi:curved DNA-binding protein